MPLSRDRGLRTLCCLGSKAQAQCRIHGFQLFHFTRDSRKHVVTGDRAHALEEHVIQHVFEHVI